MKRLPALAALLLTPLLACGDVANHQFADAGAGDGKPGDGSITPGVITIKLYRHTMPTTAGDTANADFVAFQDGDGAWQPLVGTSGVYTGHITGTRYGVAIGCAGRIAQLRVYQFATSETTELHDRACATTATTVAVSGRIVDPGVTPTGEVLASGNVSTSIDPNGGYSVQVTPGPLELIARITDPTQPNRVAAFARTPVMNVQAPTSITISVPLQGGPPLANNLTVNGAAAGEALQLSADLVTPTGSFSLDYGSGVAGMTNTYQQLATNLRQPTDLVRVAAQGSSNSPLRGAAIIGKDLAAVTLTFPAAATAPTVSFVATPTPRPVLTFLTPTPSLAHRVYVASVSQTSAAGNTGAAVTLFVGAGWLGAGGMASYTLPDLSTVAGWNPQQAFTAGMASNWFFAAEDVNRVDLADVADGDQARFTGASGQATP
jgi:hypothetical protein